MTLISCPDSISVARRTKYPHTLKKKKQQQRQNKHLVNLVYIKISYMLEYWSISVFKCPFKLHITFFRIQLQNYLLLEIDDKCKPYWVRISCRNFTLWEYNHLKASFEDFTVSPSWHLVLKERQWWVGRDLASEWCGGCSWPSGEVLLVSPTETSLIDLGG